MRVRTEPHPRFRFGRVVVVTGRDMVWKIGVVGPEWVPFRAPGTPRGQWLSVTRGRGGWGEGLGWHRYGPVAVRRHRKGIVPFLDRPRQRPLAANR